MRKMLLRGCNGRMGRAISEIIPNYNDIVISAGVDINPVKYYSYPVYAELVEFPNTVDVVLDFSRPDNIERLLAWCEKRNTPLVLATTGFSSVQIEMIEACSKNIPVFMSGNMSLGINLLSDLAARAAEVLGEGYDVEIVERHHNQKLDAPSGTALMLLKAVSDALPFAPDTVYDRHQRREIRPSREIGIHSVRGGSIIGDHDVIFAGRGETITVSHSAVSRDVFASGAIRAAMFMADISKPGMYGMKDMLKKQV